MEDYSLKPVKRPKTSTPVTIIICIVFGLLSFIFALCSGVLFSVRDILSEQALSSAVGKLDPTDWEIGMFLSGEEIDDLAQAWYLPKNKIDENSTLSEIVSASAAQYGLSVSAHDVEELLDKSGIVPAVGKLFGSYERYFLTGEDNEPFSRRALMAEIKKHGSEIQEHTGVDISIFYDAIEATLRKNSRTLSRLNPSELTDGAGQYTHIVLSLPAIIVCVALSAAMMIVALLITKRPVACTRTLGIVFMSAGTVLLMASLMLPTILKDTLTMLRPGAVKYIARILNSSAAPFLTRYGVIFVIAGALLTVISIMCEVIYKKIVRIKANRAEKSPDINASQNVQIVKTTEMIQQTAEKYQAHEEILAAESKIIPEEFEELEMIEEPEPLPTDL